MNAFFNYLLLTVAFATCRSPTPPEPQVEPGHAVWEKESEVGFQTFLGVGKCFSCHIIHEQMDGLLAGFNSPPTAEKNALDQ